MKRNHWAGMIGTAALLAASMAQAQPAAATPGTPYLRSEQFKRDFLASYGIRTDIEPRLNNEQEKVRLEEMTGLIATNPRQAVRDLEAFTTEETSAQFDFVLGNLYFQGGDMDRAAARYLQATRKFPNFLRAHKNLGTTHFQKGRYAEAIRSLGRAIELGGTDGTLMGILGLAYLNTDRWLSAESAFRNASLLQPEVADWKMGLARTLFAQQKFGEAAAFMDELIAQSPERAEYWMLQANAFISMQQPLKAAENIEVLIRLGKAAPDALNLLGDIYVDERLHDLAARAYVMAIDADPDKGLAGGVRAAELLAQCGAPDAARQVVARVRDSGIEDLPEGDKRRLLKTEARVASAGGSGEDVAKVLQEIVELDPLDGEALLLLGRYYQQKGETERAILMYERAEGIAAVEADARVRHAQVLIGQGKYADALPLLKRAQEIKPRDAVGQFLDQVERLVRRRR